MNLSLTKGKSIFNRNDTASKQRTQCSRLTLQQTVNTDKNHRLQTQKQRNQKAGWWQGNISWRKFLTSDPDPVRATWRSRPDFTWHSKLPQLTTSRDNTVKHVQDELSMNMWEWSLCSTPFKSQKTIESPEYNTTLYREDAAQIENVQQRDLQLRVRPIPDY